MKMFSIYDRKSQRFGTPFFCIDHIAAQRTFIRFAKSEDSPVSEYPEDFELDYLGDFDESKGSMSVIGKPEVVITGITAARKNQENKAGMKGEKAI